MSDLLKKILLTPKEVGDILRIRTTKTYQLINSGELGVPVRIGKGVKPRLRIRSNEVKRYIKENGLPL